MNIAVINLLRIGDVFQTIPLLLWLNNYKLNHKNEHVNLIFLTDELDIDIIKQLSIVYDIIKIKYRKILSLLSVDGKVENKRMKNLISVTDHLSNLPYKKIDKVFNLGTNQISCYIADFILDNENVASKIVGPYFNENIIYKDNFLSENNLTLNRQFRYLYEISIYKDLSLVNLAEIYLSFIIDSGLIVGKKIDFNEFYLFYNSFYKSSKLYFEKKDQKNPSYNKRSIIINISTGDLIREFNASFFSNLINNLVNENYKVIIVGILGNKSTDTNKNKDLIILSSLPDIVKKDVVNLCNKTDILSLLDLFNSSDLFITPDTGSIHLAASLSGIKILGLYNISAYHQLTGAYSDRTYFLTPNLDCYPCEESFQPCRDRNSNIGVDIFECKKSFTAKNIIQSVRYILNGEGIKELGDLTLSKSSINEKLCDTDIIFGSENTIEKRIIKIIVKELLFKTDFRIDLLKIIDSKEKNNFLFELVLIYQSAKKANDYIDFINFVKKNKTIKDYAFILELI